MLNYNSVINYLCIVTFYVKSKYITLIRREIHELSILLYTIYYDILCNREQVDFFSKNNLNNKQT